MCLLFRFSRYISVPVLLEWIEVGDLVSLDSAICNTKARENLISLTAEYKVKFRESLIPNHMLMPLSVELMDWCDHRQLGKLEKVVLYNSFIQRFANQNKVSQTLSLLSLGSFRQKTKIREDKKLLVSEYRTCLSGILHLEIPGLSSFHADVLSSVLKYCEKLESISLRNTDSNELLKVVKKSGVNLKQLSIHCSSVKEKTVMLICRQSPHLTSLTLRQSLELSSSSWHQLTVHNRKLTSLYLDKIHNRGLQQFSLHCATQHPLSELTCHQASDISVRAAVWFRGSSLLRIDLSHSPGVNDFTLSEIGAACPSLREVRLKSCDRLTTAGVHALCSQVPGLQLLDLQNLSLLTNEAIASVVLQCKELHTLLLYSQEHVTKTGLCYIGTFAASLTHLSLCNMLLNDDTLLHIMLRCTLLRNVELGINGRVTDAAFHKLLPLCGAVLRRLDLTCCDRLTELTLFALAEYCNGLTDLNVSICNLVSDKGVACVVRECKELRVLSVYYCKCVSDVSMEAVALYGRNLTDLNIGHTAVASTAAVEGIVRGCARLKELKLTLGDQDKLVKFAEKIRPNLRMQFLQ